MKDVTETMAFKSEDLKRDNIKHVLQEVKRALDERGYNSVNQLAGYLISNDPAYISSHIMLVRLFKRLNVMRLLKNLFEVIWKKRANENIRIRFRKSYVGC